MKIKEHLYFAPGVKFSSVDTNSIVLAQQLNHRIRGFYLNPVYSLIEGSHAFAAGVLIVVSIDAIARLDNGSDGKTVGDRFSYWCNANLPSCKGQKGKQFYLSFRNGLVHEARLKDGCEFTLETKDVFQDVEGVLSCNPSYLLAEVESAFKAFIRTLEEDPAKLEYVRQKILTDFDYEFNN